MRSAKRLGLPRPAADSEECFSAMKGVPLTIESVPLAQAEETYDRIKSGRAPFHVVLSVK